MSVNWLYQPSHKKSLVHTLLEYEQKWLDQYSIEEIELELEKVVCLLADSKDDNNSAQDNLYKIIDILIDEVGFTGPGMQTLPESALSNLSFCIMHRTGNELTLGIVFCYLLNQLGFTAMLSNVDDDIVLVVKLTYSEYIIVDALSGATEYLISQQDVKEKLTNDISRYASPCELDELVKIALTDQKLSMLDEGLYAQALSCVEVLMELLPEDPYERRDRGLVLNQLDCEAWAKDDLDYFVKACPNDPMATFIRLQLEEQHHIVDTIH
jgi:regulator of sirC expression with transglutaminase-like and TPR domain